MDPAASTRQLLKHIYDTNTYNYILLYKYNIYDTKPPTNTSSEHDTCLYASRVKPE